MATKGMPSRSMTGFGRATLAREDLTLEAEIRSINSRYLDLNFRIPKNYLRFEPELRKLLSAALERGRVEINVNRTVASGGKNIKADQELAQQYFEAAKSICIKQGIWDDSLSPNLMLDILGKREVLDNEENEQVDEAVELEHLLAVTQDALDDLLEMKKKEGTALATDISARLGVLATLHGEISEHVACSAENIQERLTRNIEPLLAEGSLDKDRLLQEVAYLAEKADVTEELSRLESHFDQAETILSAHPHGRKMEFLVQEMGREFNTIASKAQNATVQQRVVDAKAELEKIREQVQNIE